MYVWITETMFVTKLARSEYSIFKLNCCLQNIRWDSYNNKSIALLSIAIAMARALRNDTYIWVCKFVDLLCKLKWYLIVISIKWQTPYTHCDYLNKPKLPNCCIEAATTNTLNCTYEWYETMEGIFWFSVTPFGNSHINDWNCIQCIVYILVSYVNATITLRQTIHHRTLFASWKQTISNWHNDNNK